MTSRETSVLSQIINIWPPCIWKQRAFLLLWRACKEVRLYKIKKKDIRKKVKGLQISQMVHTWIEYLREMKLENIPSLPILVLTLYVKFISNTSLIGVFSILFLQSTPHICSPVMFYSVCWNEASSALRDPYCLKNIVQPPRKTVRLLRSDSKLSLITCWLTPKLHSLSRIDCCSLSLFCRLLILYPHLSNNLSISKGSGKITFLSRSSYAIFNFVMWYLFNCYI